MNWSAALTVPVCSTAKSSPGTSRDMASVRKRIRRLFFKFSRGPPKFPYFGPTWLLIDAVDGGESYTWRNFTLLSATWGDCLKRRVGCLDAKTRAQFAPSQTGNPQGTAVEVLGDPLPA